jgi:hypothetical protein
MPLVSVTSEDSAMNAKDVIRQALGTSVHVVKAYVGDLSDAEMLKRPGPGCNHVAWQLGHLIASECQLLEAVKPGAAPELPAGFAEAHSKDTSGSDDPAKFGTKQQYLDLMDKVNAASLAALDTYSETDLDQPSPEKMRKMFPTMGALFVLIATHPMMHAGQFVPVRRALGKPILI